MRFKVKFIIIMIIYILINLNSICYAKYVYEDTDIAIQVNVDRTPPILKLEYLYTTDNKEVQVKIIANELIKEVEGWNLEEDGKTLTKKYDKNATEKIEVQDLSGNKSYADIIVDKIIKDFINAEIIEVTNNNIGYENYANKEHEITVTIKVSFDKGIKVANINNLLILVGNTKAECTKNIEILERNENYIICKAKLSKINGNGELKIKIPENTFEDYVGNKMSEKTLNSKVKIDNIAPNAIFNQETLSDGKILAQILSNEPIREVDGWQINSDKMIISKEFISDIRYRREIKDLAGNTKNVLVEVKESTYLGFDFIAYISDKGWIKAENGLVGTIQSGNKLKIEGLAFRISPNVDKDFFRASAYVKHYWGENNYGKCIITNSIYNYGYNPKSSYKTMNDELVTIDGKQYFQIGGGGLNKQGNIDSNCSNPIPEEVANKYNYGISSVRLYVKDEQYSVIYQEFWTGKNWEITCRDGSEVFGSNYRPIDAIRIAIVPKTELFYAMREWDKNIGTFNIN